MQWIVISWCFITSAMEHDYTLRIEHEVHQGWPMNYVLQFEYKHLFKYFFIVLSFYMLFGLFIFNYNSRGIYRFLHYFKQDKLFPNSNICNLNSSKDLSSFNQWDTAVHGHLVHLMIGAVYCPSCSVAVNEERYVTKWPIMLKKGDGTKI